MKIILRLEIIHDGLALEQKDFEKFALDSDSLGIMNIKYRLNIIKGELTDDQWENEDVELTINTNPFITLKRSQMMWFFFFDIIHHRGQLSAYVRPMGGKNPAVYGYSADSQ